MHRQAARYGWALLLARIHEAFPLLCPKCGGKMRIIAFNTEVAVVRDILAHLGEPTVPQRMVPARGPPLWKVTIAGPGGFAPQAQTTSRNQLGDRLRLPELETILAEVPLNSLSFLDRLLTGQQ